MNTIEHLEHGRIDCELIAAGETKMQRSAYGLIVLLTLTAIPLSAEAAPAQADSEANCVASVDAIRAEWRKLSHSSSLNLHNASVPEMDASSLARS
jgi:hypothetical protein